MFKKFAKLLGLIIVAGVGYLLLWPVPIDPQVWDAPKNAGYVGTFAPNTKLGNLKTISVDPYHGPEDAAVGPDGMVYVSVKDGKILKIDPASGKTTVFVESGGRPLGVEFGPDGKLYFTDSKKGVFRVSMDGKLELLTDQITGGKKLVYANDIDIAADGTVYFSHSSSKFGAATVGTYESSLLDLMEHGHYGEVFKWDPKTKETTKVAGGFSYANGLALSKDDDYLVVASTGEYKVDKIWLKGEKAGQKETIITNFPGFPDNINPAADGTFWIGLVSPRSDPIDNLSGKPFVRKIVQRLPAFMRPKATRYGFIVRFDGNGKIIEQLQDPSKSYGMTTGAAEGLKGQLIVTSLFEKSLGILTRK